MRDGEDRLAKYRRPKLNPEAAKVDPSQAAEIGGSFQRLAARAHKQARPHPAFLWCCLVIEFLFTVVPAFDVLVRREIGRRQFEVEQERLRGLLHIHGKNCSTTAT